MNESYPHKSRQTLNTSQTVKLLLISASPKGERSASNRLAQTFVDEYRRLHPDHNIVTYSLFDIELPEFGEELCLAKFAPVYGEEMTHRQQAEWQRVLDLIEHFASFDKIVLATPMWNYSIPYKLKHYFDIIVQPFVTFGYDPEKRAHFGVLKDRPVQLLITRSSVAVGDEFDFQLPYLKTIFNFIGLSDLRVVVASQTTQPTQRERDQYLESFSDQLRDAARAF
jgi:FMN-dependent NADH-azoreductase